MFKLQVNKLVNKKGSFLPFFSFRYKRNVCIPYTWWFYSSFCIIWFTLLNTFWRTTTTKKHCFLNSFLSRPVPPPNVRSVVHPPPSVVEPHPFRGTLWFHSSDFFVWQWCQLFFLCSFDHRLCVIEGECH